MSIQGTEGYREYREYRGGTESTEAHAADRPAAEAALGRRAPRLALAHLGRERVVGSRHALPVLRAAPAADARRPREDTAKTLRGPLESRTHARTHAHARARTCSCTHGRARARTHMHACTRTPTHRWVGARRTATVTIAPASTSVAHAAPSPRAPAIISAVEQPERGAWARARSALNPMRPYDADVIALTTLMSLPFRR